MWQESSTTKLTDAKPIKPARVLLPLNLRLPKVMPKAEAAGSAKPGRKNSQQSTRLNAVKKGRENKGKQTEDQRSQHGDGRGKEEAGKKDTGEVKHDAGHLRGTRSQRQAG